MLVGHSGSGKTALAEALLHAAGVTTRMGRIEDGNTVSDFEPEEISRGSSVSLAMAPFEWAGHRINIIDTPGYSDFIGDARAAHARRRPGPVRHLRRRRGRGADRGPVAHGRRGRHRPGLLRQQARPGARLLLPHPHPAQGGVRHRRRPAAGAHRGRAPAVGRGPADRRHRLHLRRRAQGQAGHHSPGGREGSRRRCTPPSSKPSVETDDSLLERYLEGNEPSSEEADRRLAPRDAGRHRLPRAVRRPPPG